MKKLVILALLLAATSAANAQETRDTIALSQLVVSVTRLPIERAAATAAVTVLNGDELRARGVHTVADALRSVSGTALTQSAMYGAFGSLFLRGGESDYVQVLLDGVRVNSPGEHFDFGNFTLENIERIEIVRGPVSVLYGSDAVTGIVQLFTKKGIGGTHYEFAGSGGWGDRVGPGAQGTFASESFRGELSGGGPRANYSLGGTHFRSDGAYAINSRNRNTSFTGHAGIAPDAVSSVSATVRYSQNDLHYPTDGAGNVVDRNQRNVSDAFAAGVEMARTFSPKLQARALLSLDRNDDRYRDAPDNAGDTLGFYAGSSNERFQHEALDVSMNYSLPRQFTLTLGGEYDHQHERGSSLTESQFGLFNGSSRNSRDNRALYAQLLTSTGRVNLQAGARLDDNSRFGTFGTYRGGVSVPVGTHLRLRASAGTSFKQPRFYEQFATDFVRGNPDLKPEQSRSIDGGAEFLTMHSRLSATVFTQRFHNLIQYVTNAAPTEPNYTNLGAARSNGVELEAERTLARSFRARAGYTLLDTKVIDPGTGQDPLFRDGKPLLRRPRHSGSLSLAYTRSSWRASATGNLIGRRDDLDFNNYPRRVTMEGYTRVDVSADARVPFTPARLTIEIDNVLNANYEEMYNFPARRRMVFVGLRLGN